MNPIFGKLDWTLIIIFTSLLISCNQIARVKPYNKTITFSKANYIDTSLIALIPFEQFGKFVFDSSYKAASLTSSDLAQIDSLFMVCVNNYNNTLPKHNNHFSISSGDYRQYIAATNNKGEKKFGLIVSAKQVT